MQNDDFSRRKPAMLAGLAQYVSFQSISADKQFRSHCEACHTWLSEQLKGFGCAVERIETIGLPLVYGEISGGEPGPTVLFYGHYDVQPPEPLELWESDPFVMTERSGKLFARGAQDNKGQSWYAVQAIKSLVEQNALKGKVKFLIEGEEESGSKGLSKLLPELKGKISADILLVCDTGTLIEEKGAITMGLRGVAHLEVKVSGPSRDLHSGVHGGVAPNPALALVGMLAKLHDSSGKVAVPGFYEEVKTPSRDDLALAEALPLSDVWYKDLTGVLPTGGEKGRGIAERRGFRPTIEINGITSGYQGEGSKTIIPSSATAKLSIRLVSDQDPDVILKLTEEYLKLNTPFGLDFSVVERAAAGRALQLSSSSSEIQRAAQVLKNITGSDPLYVWEGASIPVLTQLAEVSGGTPVLVGFGLDEDAIHAPNESFKISQFEKGYNFIRSLLGTK